MTSGRNLLLLAAFDRVSIFGLCATAKIGRATAKIGRATAKIDVPLRRSWPCGLLGPPHTLADGSMAGPTRISTIAALVVVPAVDQIIIASGRCARRPHAVVATATDAAVVIVRAVLAAPSFVRKKGHHSAAVAAVVVAPLHLRLVDYVVAIKQQQLTVRTGFDPQAC